MKKLFLFVIVLSLVHPSFSSAQIKNPNIPRSGSKTFIEQTAEKAFSFPTDSRTYANNALISGAVAVFTPRDTTSIQAVDVWFNSNANPDSTLYLVFAQSANRDTAMTIDSTGKGFINYWQSNSLFQLAAAGACTLFVMHGSNSASLGKGVITIHAQNK